MGGHPWFYFVPYDRDMNRALQVLRQREFEAGRYNPVVIIPEFPITSVSPSPGPRHHSIESALEAAGSDGARCILDMERVSEEYDYGVVSPLSAKQLLKWYGTEHPTREMIEQNMYSNIERGHGISIVAYKKGKPAEIFFAGYSYD